MKSFTNRIGDKFSTKKKKKKTDLNGPKCRQN